MGSGLLPVSVAMVYTSTWPNTVSSGTADLLNSSTSRDPFDASQAMSAPSARQTRAGIFSP